MTEALEKLKQDAAFDEPAAIDIQHEAADDPHFDDWSRGARWQHDRDIKIIDKLIKVVEIKDQQIKNLILSLAAETKMDASEIEKLYSQCQAKALAILTSSSDQSFQEEP